MNNQKKGLFHQLGNTLDKILITPISKLVYYLQKKFFISDKTFEKILNHRTSLLTISLVLALIIFYFFDNKMVSLIYNNAEVLSGQPVIAEYNKESYVVEGLPESVDITLIGKKGDVYLAKQYPSEGVVADLKNLKAGRHKVRLKYKNAVSSISYKLDPSEVMVTIYEKLSVNKTIVPDVIYENKIDQELTIDKVELNIDKVIVKGPEYKLNDIATVKAVIDVSKLPNPKEGIATLKNIPVIAYNSVGEKIDVEFVSEDIEATITISSPFKEVPINIINRGEPKEKAISSMIPSKRSVILYGPRDILDAIDSLPVELDVEGLTKNKEFTVNLVVPKGVRKIDIKTIKVQVSLDNIVTKEIKKVGINPVNVGNGYAASAYSEEDSVIDVIVSGAKKAVDDAKEKDIKVKLDLSGLGEGTHEVEVVVTGKDQKLTYTPRVKTRKVTIVKK